MGRGRKFIQMRKKIIEFMRENGIMVFAEADRVTRIVHIEKLGGLERWDLFQQLVLYSDVDVWCDSTRSRIPFQTWGQGNTGCLISCRQRSYHWQFNRYYIG